MRYVHLSCACECCLATVNVRRTSLSVHAIREHLRGPGPSPNGHYVVQIISYSPSYRLITERDWRAGTMDRIGENRIMAVGEKELLDMDDLDAPSNIFTSNQL
ncbi:hypothetical protein MTP99_006641 [Tenebrio molitor]|jgi:hypothetical protein|nr:hypothetical protein MTP99_006641 [Tenebrio molitor]